MKRINAFDLLEIAVLLALPMLSSKLGFLYIVLVLTIILLAMYRRKEKWSDYGFKAVKLDKVLLAALVGVGFSLFTTYIQEPLVTKLTGETADLSMFDHVQDNFGAFITLLAMGWFVGGLFEEFLFRGYLLTRINQVVKYPEAGKWLGILLTSITFGIAHSYQGVGGMINTFIFSVVLGLLFYIFKRNTWYVILIHGFFDTCGIAWLYLGW